MKLELQSSLRGEAARPRGGKILLHMIITKTISKIKVRKPFRGKKIYFSNSVTGVPDVKRDFGWRLVAYMKKNGAEVLSDFVGARSKDEHIKMFLEKTNFDRDKEPIPWFFVRKTDTKYVDEATHLVTVVNGPSLAKKLIYEFLNVN